MRNFIRFFIIFIALLFIVKQWDIDVVYAKEEQPSQRLDLNLEGLEKNESKYKWGGDPFLMPSSVRKKGDAGILKVNGMSLNGLIYRKGGGIAIINNKIMKKGDVIYGKKIVDILQDRVILEDGDERIELMVEKFSSNP